MEKTFLCLGAGPGIGLATAMKFGSEGFRIVLGARNRERLAELAAKISNETGKPVETAVIDVSNYDQLVDLKNRVGEVDVLHFNATIIHSKTLLEEDYADIGEDIAVGISGAIYAIKTFAPVMFAKKSGAILLTGGVLALKPLPEYITLGIAKAGIRNMTEALFDDFRQNNVHIANITVAASVAPYSIEASDIAELFWKIYRQPREIWTWNEDYQK